MSENTIALDGVTFDEVLAGSSQPVLVDFWAEWCTPCKMVAPILDEIAAENPDRIVVAKVDIDEHQDLALRFDVMSIPTLILFEGGQPVKRVVGAKGKNQLLEELSEFL